MKTRRYVSRNSRKGAALVEAAVVLPVLVALLGVGMMLFRAYAEKLEANQEIRAAALDFASHDCERRALLEGPAPRRDSRALTGSDGRDVSALGSGVTGPVLREVGRSSPALSGRSGTARAEYAARTIDNPRPSQATGGFVWRLTLHAAHAETFCNDPPREGAIAGLAEYVRDQVAR